MFILEVELKRVVPQIDAWKNTKKLAKKHKSRRTTHNGEASNNFMSWPPESNQNHKKLLHLKSNLG